MHGVRTKWQQYFRSSAQPLRFSCNIEKPEEEHFSRFAAFCFGTSVMLFRATRGLAGHENT